MSVTFVELFPVLVLWTFGWMLPVALLAWLFVQLRRHGLLHPFVGLFHKARRLPPVAALGLAVFVGGFVVLGSTKNDGGSTNDPPSRMSAPRRAARTPASPVTGAEIAAGYRIPEETSAGLLSLPEGAVTNGLWRLRGAHDDAFRVEPEGWRFPYRDGVMTGLTVLARGEARPDVGTLYFPVPVASGVSLLPASRWSLLPDGGASVFRHGMTTNGSLLLDWRNALVGRDASCPTNLQLELFPDGRFAWRTDDASRLYLPVFPFDWDGDGLENSVDPDPFVAGLDAHGTNAEWYKVVCTNVFIEAMGAEPGDPDVPRLLPEGVGFRPDVNSNGFYFVELVAEQGPAPVYVVSGQDSLLGSPVLVARPGETNRVPLVIGVTYGLTSSVPFSVELPMDGFAELLRNESNQKTVKWPLMFAFSETENHGGSRVYSVNVGPYDPGGCFSWEGEDALMGRASLMGTGRSTPECGCVSTAGGSVTFCCSKSCDCGGTCEASGFYYVAGSIFGVTGGVCRCGFDDPGDDEPPTPPEETPSGVSVSVSFSKAAVIFEDAYENGPGESVPRKSTRVRLDLNANGGPNGGTLSFEGANLEKLVSNGGSPISLPSSRDLLPYEDFHESFICEGVVASGGANDIAVYGYISDNEMAQSSTDSASLTAVKIEVVPLVQYPADYPNRHVFGVCETVQLFTFPSSLVGGVWSSSGGVLESECIRNVQNYMYLLDAGTANFTFSLGDAQYVVRTICMLPTDIVCRNKPLCLTHGLRPGEAGGVGMRMDLTILPDTVSFSGIRVEERVTDDGVPEGYFNQARFRSWWNHQAVQGAGTPVTVGPENDIVDTADMGNRCPELDDGWWSDGSISWSIPCAWKEPFGFVVSRRFSDYTTKEQRFVIDASGTVQVLKFGCRAVRTAWGYAETFIGQ